MQHDKATNLESEALPINAPPKRGFQGWIKVGAIAAASALAGGLAAAWYYRKTLDTLREAESHGENPNFEIPDSETEIDG
jgi:hypothetical protein